MKLRRGVYVCVCLMCEVKAWDISVCKCVCVSVCTCYVCEFLFVCMLMDVCVLSKCVSVC